MTKPIRMGLGVGEKLAILFLRNITRNEEQTFLASHAAITTSKTPEEKEILQTEACIEALAAWSEASPIDKDGETETPWFKDKKSAAEDVKRLFEEARSDGIDISRLADAAVLQYRLRLTPVVVFL